MGIPQTRHRVFFVATRLCFNLDCVNMYFNYEPVTYGIIKEGVGESLKNTTTNTYKLLQMATPNDKRIADIYLRLGEKEKCFNDKIVWEHRVFNTVAAGMNVFRGKDKTKTSCEDIINAQTFPRDYNFINRTLPNVIYLCGMSVPPIMIKRLVIRLIESGLFDYKLKK
jgi:site-specific DNA-cytosine methylase